MKNMHTNRNSDVQQDISPTQIKIATREGRPLFLALSVLAGTITFCLAMQSLGEFVPKDWWWIALAITIICLPAAFDKLRRSPEPYTIQFARAFRIGFWSIFSAFGQLIGSNYLHLAKALKYSVNSSTHKFGIDST